MKNFKKVLSISEQDYLLNQFEEFNKKHCLVVRSAGSIFPWYTPTDTFALIVFPNNEIQLKGFNLYVEYLVMTEENEPYVILDDHSGNETYINLKEIGQNEYKII